MTKQRRSSWTPVIVSNLANQANGLDAQRPRRTSRALIDSEDNSDFFDLTTQRRADLRFAIWVALTLAIPAVIGLCIYEAAKSIILITS